MLSKNEVLKISKLYDLEKRYKKLYKEVCYILKREYPDEIEFDNGDRIGDIITKEEIPKIAQKNDSGTYSTYTPHGEDWGGGTIYIPLNNEYEEFLEIYYST